MKFLTITKLTSSPFSCPKPFSLTQSTNPNSQFFILRHRKMGSTVSSIPGQSWPPGTLSWPELDDIPESFIALVLSSFEPPVIAKLAGINRDFHAASSADFIWVSKLPPTYPYIISKLCDQSIRDKCKKDIYAGLCRPNPFDGGTKVCVCVCARARL